MRASSPQVRATWRPPPAPMCRSQSTRSGRSRGSRSRPRRRRQPRPRRGSSRPGPPAARCARWVVVGDDDPDRTQRALAVGLRDGLPAMAPIEPALSVRWVPRGAPRCRLGGRPPRPVRPRRRGGPGSTGDAGAPDGGGGSKPAPSSFTEQNTLSPPCRRSARRSDDDAAAPPWRPALARPAHRWRAPRPRPAGSSRSSATTTRRTP